MVEISIAAGNDEEAIEKARSIYDRVRFVHILQVEALAGEAEGRS
ncbi:MAG: hypothetical protein ABR962_07280 [Candidatus Bathyarchaeia archaeon]|jgi:hypothetical protein